MAKLVEVYRNEEQRLTKRQLPLTVDDLTMIMDINSLGFYNPNTSVRAKEVDKFLDMFNSLSAEEVREAFSVDSKEFLASLDQVIPCVGCRRSVERLFEQLRKSGHPALDPLGITSNGVLTVKEDVINWPRALCTLLHGHNSRLNQLIDSQFRSKKSRRCNLHSLDYQRVRAPWRELWDAMRPQCREEVLLIDATSLMVTLEGYLQKHRFCGECRTKVLKAYWLLVEEAEPTREKGYVPALYAGIKRCLPDKHIHLPTNTEYITTLLARVQPDAMGSGERHAKTLEVAQGEVITCLGLCILERLHRIQMRLKEEETTCQVLAAVAIDALSRKFEITVELKRGISKLELLYAEFTKEDIAKQQRKEQKKLKRKKRREKKAGSEKPNEENEEFGEPSCQLQSACSDVSLTASLEANESAPLETSSKVFSPQCPAQETPPESKKTVNKSSEDGRPIGTNFICEYTQDCGYSSGNNNASSSAASSPEGSEVACCEEFCNDEGVCRKSNPSKSNPPETNRFTLSLEEMLEDTTSSDEESFIPIEDVKEFQSRDNITQKREELRQTLRMRFAQMCITRNHKC